jgi:hypothetical protein
VVSASKVVFGDGKKETEIGLVRQETIISNGRLFTAAASIVALGAAWEWRGKLPKRLKIGRNARKVI